MNARQPTIWRSLKVTTFVLCALWWGGLNCLVACVGDEWVKATESCEHHCCVVQKAAAATAEMPALNASSAQAMDCCALADLTALETSPPKNVAPALLAPTPKSPAFLFSQSSSPFTYASFSPPDKSNTRLLNCVWRI
jgi:hypothetical protein